MRNIYLSVRIGIVWIHGQCLRESEWTDQKVYGQGGVEDDVFH